MDTIDEKTQYRCEKENVTAEIRNLDSQLTEGDQNMSGMASDGENFISDSEKIVDPRIVMPVSGAVADFVNLELQQLKEQLLRVQADFDNYRRRAIRDQDDLRRFACMDLIGGLLPILDSFELGLKSAQDNSSTLSGFQMIFTQLQTLLTTKGVKEIAPQGEIFSPQWAEAIAYVYDENVPREHVVQTVRKGYLLHDRLLRPASVVVSKGAQTEENK
ncbi:MAG: nucleotide exchange factor GrpE [Puniceicoccales bacterium]|jgi:molecular chaperone GrpE|nr:nucleotide exchange factor GrpE [Puniceicoccales bacterium]